MRANQYAAIGAWDAQLTDEPTQPIRPRQPRRTRATTNADAGGTAGSTTAAGGFLDPAYLKTLPDTARKFGVAVRATVADKMRRFRTRGGDALISALFDVGRRR